MYSWSYYQAKTDTGDRKIDSIPAYRMLSFQSFDESRGSSPRELEVSDDESYFDRNPYHRS